MTIWDKIYQNYKKTGENYNYTALKEELMPEFLKFVEGKEFKIKRALDIGCGSGKYLVYLKSLGFEVTGIDSSPTAVEMTKSKISPDADIICSDIYGYTLPHSRFGLIFSIATIHHGLKRQVRDAIKQIHLALATGGLFYITLPDNEGSAHWTSMVGHQEIEPGTRVPLIGPEKGLPHSSYTKEEIREMFADFTDLNMELISKKGRWIITGKK